MSYKDDFNVFVGGQSGVFKGIKVKEKTCLIKNIQNLISITDHDKVTFMTWTNEDEKEILLGCGKKGARRIKAYDSENHSFTTSFVCDVGEGCITGIARYNEHLLTAVESGHIKLWNDEKDEYLLDAGAGLCRMRQSTGQRHVIATGGLENPLKLFDLQTKKSFFTAKNVRNDWLEMRVPLSISDLCFLSNGEQVATVGKYGHIRLYDTKAQRRPVISLEIKEEAVTTLANCTDDNQIICGTGKGRINLIDFRKPGKILNSYKGPVGAVTALGVSKTEPLIVSTSFDRHLYVHNKNTKALVNKIYLTSKITGLVVRSEFCMKEDEKAEEVTLDDDSDDAEYEEIHDEGMDADNSNEDSEDEEMSEDSEDEEMSEDTNDEDEKSTDEEMDDDDSDEDSE